MTTFEGYAQLLKTLCLNALVREMDQLFPTREKSTQSELTDFEARVPESQPSFALD